MQGNKLRKLKRMKTIKISLWKSSLQFQKNSQKGYTVQTFYAKPCQFS